MPEWRFKFIFTPKHGSWLNIIESFFSKMTKQVLRRIRVKQEFIDRIYKYFKEINADSVVFHWKYKMDEIVVRYSVILYNIYLISAIVNYTHRIGKYKKFKSPFFLNCQVILRLLRRLDNPNKVVLTQDELLVCSLIEVHFIKKLYIFILAFMLNCQK